MSTKEVSNMRKIIKLGLLKLGIRCDFIGFKYLCLAVEKVIINPELMTNLCENLYVMIGKENGTDKYSTVERDIRHAIDTAFRHDNFEKLKTMFGEGLCSKPTVSELIALMAEYYNLKLYKQ